MNPSVSYGKQRFSLIQGIRCRKKEEVPGTRVKITDRFVPVGTIHSGFLRRGILRLVTALLSIVLDG